MTKVVFKILYQLGRTTQSCEGFRVVAGGGILAQIPERRIDNDLNFEISGQFIYGNLAIIVR